jgi:hypothetical protein
MNARNARPYRQTLVGASIEGREEASLRLEGFLIPVYISVSTWFRETSRILLWFGAILQFNDGAFKTVYRRRNLGVRALLYIDAEHNAYPNGLGQCCNH